MDSNDIPCFMCAWQRGYTKEQMKEAFAKKIADIDPLIDDMCAEHLILFNMWLDGTIDRQIMFGVIAKNARAHGQ